MSDLTAVMHRPILFSGAMVHAILEGRKTQTRRVIKPQPEYAQRDGRLLRLEEINPDLWPTATARLLPSCPYGAKGHRLWVRETWAVRSLPSGLWVEYKADGDNIPLPGPDEHDIRDEGGKVDLARYATPADHWRPSIHMPRWASRIDIEITGVRVERVQDISEEDAIAEGIPPWDRDPNGVVPRIGFASLWDSINGERGYGWDANPWVWVVEFRRD